jgi:hypothetical protein
LSARTTFVIQALAATMSGRMKCRWIGFMLAIPMVVYDSRPGAIDLDRAP